MNNGGGIRKRPSYRHFPPHTVPDAIVRQLEADGTMDSLLRELVNRIKHDVRTVYKHECTFAPPFPPRHHGKRLWSKRPRQAAYCAANTPSQHPRTRCFRSCGRNSSACVVVVVCCSHHLLVLPRPALVHKVGMVAREILHSSANEPHTMGSKLHKVAQRAAKAWRAKRAADRRAYEEAADGDTAAQPPQ